MPLTYGNLYTLAARLAGDTSTTGTSRARDAVVLAIRELSYGSTLPPMRPWWRKREDTITPVDGTQSYAFPTAQGTYESLYQVWYRTNGMRQFIDVVDDERWANEANEDTTETGTPDIANIHRSSGTVRLRLSITPGSAWIAALSGGLLRLDFFIEDTLAQNLITGTGSDATEPLMPDALRPGILYKAVELLAISQSDLELTKWALVKGQQYYHQIIADDVYRTSQTRAPGPIERPGDVGAGRATDYGRRI